MGVFAIARLLLASSLVPSFAEDEAKLRLPTSRRPFLFNPSAPPSNQTNLVGKTGTARTSRSAAIRELNSATTGVTAPAATVTTAMIAP
jgi:hypothetical protein